MFGIRDGVDMVETLKSLRGKVYWKRKYERYDFFSQLKTLITHWAGPLPELRDIFRPKEIDWILNQSKSFAVTFTEFAISTGYKDEPEIGKDGKPSLRRSTPLHQAARKTVGFEADEIRRLFQIYDRFDVNYIDEFGVTHFHVACMWGFFDVIEKFLEHGQDPNVLEPNKRNSPLHLALDNVASGEVIELLLRKGADLRLVNAEGLTPLHIFCKRYDDVDLAKLLLDLSNEKHQLSQVDVQDNLGNSPLNLALEHRHRNVAELLLRNGADPNLANANGFTPLHIICWYWLDGYEVAEMLFRISAEKNQLVSLNALTKSGQAPLHMALLYGRRNLFQLLLINGADPNLADTERQTALHFISQRFDCTDFAELFFKIMDDMWQTVRVDARDKLGQTPLHLAVLHDNKSATEVLLRRGANPNLTNAEGLTPLHIICQSENREDLAKLFFKICKEVNQLVQVDVRDNQVLTPLQRVVANFMPDMIDLLLDNGADLSGLVLADAFYFVPKLITTPNRWISFAVSFASGALAVVECLERRGYELDLRDAIMIMKLFALYGLFEKSVDLEKSWCNDEEFANIAKEIKIIPSLSLYDLIQLKPREAARQVTYQNYVEFARSNKMGELPEGSIETCARHLCEKLTRRFFQECAVDSFMELTRYRLPILCSEMIIEPMINTELMRSTIRHATTFSLILPFVPVHLLRSIRLVMRMCVRVCAQLGTRNETLAADPQERECIGPTSSVMTRLYLNFFVYVMCIACSSSRSSGFSRSIRDSRLRGRRNARRGGRHSP
ncbi:unnamed protein product [Trichogramma brassicae]|uniref:Uncharacterized protein n=1 Tax=Trichogramma brassicae TaxID=86971 RepID=A0A6H5I940_9HYME|nr:unnamed protein product [Trichogramma brassicae]